MNEQVIMAAAMASRSACEQLADHLEDRDLSPVGQFYWRNIQDMYKKDPGAERLDPYFVLESSLRRIAPKQLETVTAWAEGLPETVSATLVLDNLNLLRRQHRGMELASLLVNPETPDEALAQRVAEYHALMENTAVVSTGFDWSDDAEAMEAMLDRSKALKLAPKKLNDKLRGGALPGDHILIFGRPEAGKSLFAINMAAGCLKQGKRVMYLGNEEPISRTQARIMARLSGMTLDERDAAPQAARDKALQSGYGNLFAANMHPGTLREIEARIMSVKPDVVFVDQITGLDVGAHESEVTQALKAARGFRTILGRHGCVGVSCAQAGDRTERHGQLPPAFLSMGDVYGSRTGLPAQCDVMVGIGYDQEMWDSDHRAISLPKNKLGGDHSGFLVHIDKQRSAVR